MASEVNIAGFTLLRSNPVRYMIACLDFIARGFGFSPDKKKIENLESFLVKEAKKSKPEQSLLNIFKGKINSHRISKYFPQGPGFCAICAKPVIFFAKVAHETKF